MKNSAINIFLSVVSIIIAILIIEGIAQLYVYQIAKKGKLFEPDPITGWKVKPNLDIQRKNADGENWSIKTDENGIRGNATWNSEKIKILIMGDSFAFGEGVNVANRFDSLIEKNGFSIINIGVMGYGTDQQLLLAAPYYSLLNQGDIVLILTYYNDFYDISRKSHSGRAKPWFEIVDGSLVKHSPNITIKEVLRDKSYLYAKLASLTSEHQEISIDELLKASKLYQRLIIDVAENLFDKGIKVFVAYHGIPVVKNDKHREYIEHSLNTVCANEKLCCLSLDDYFNAFDNREYFLSDGHWNNRGHEVVGNVLTKAIIQFSARYSAR